MQRRYHDIAETMQSKPGLSVACVAAEADWRQCIFSQYALRHMRTPTFVINSLYNFGEWSMLTPPYPPSTFPPDTGIPPDDWLDCYPANGRLTPESYNKCNATQASIIQGFRSEFIKAISVAIRADTPHGAFVDSCPNQHCQTSTGWTLVHVHGATMAQAAAAWYFNQASTKIVDAPFPSNPTCGYKQGVEPICNNCANMGLGSNCLYNQQTQAFHTPAERSGSGSHRCTAVSKQCGESDPTAAPCCNGSSCTAPPDCGGPTPPPPVYTCTVPPPPPPPGCKPEGKKCINDAECCQNVCDDIQCEDGVCRALMPPTSTPCPRPLG